MISSPSHNSPLHSCPFLACFLAVPYSVKHNLSVDLLSAKSHMWRASLTCVINETHSSTTVLIWALILHIFVCSLTRLKDHASYIRQNHIFQALKSIYETCRLVFPLCPLRQTATPLQCSPVLCWGRRKQRLVQTVQCPTFCRSTYFQERYGAPAIAALDG